MKREKEMTERYKNRKDRKVEEGDKEKAREINK
jgi:hypothetical protein